MSVLFAVVGTMCGVTSMVASWSGRDGAIWAVAAGVWMLCSLTQERNR